MSVFKLLLAVFLLISCALGSGRSDRKGRSGRSYRKSQESASGSESASFDGPNIKNETQRGNVTLHCNSKNILVNTKTTFKQNYASVTNLRLNNRYVVTWTSEVTNDPPNFDIRGQIFDIADNKIGNEFKINTVGNQMLKSDVSSLSNGNFIVTYDAMPNGNVYYQILKSDASKVGMEMSVGSGVSPSVVGLMNNNFVITYTSQDANGTGVYAYNGANGNIMRVNVDEFNNQKSASVTMIKHNQMNIGGFIVVYESVQENTVNIFGRLYDSNFNALSGGELIHSYNLPLTQPFTSELETGEIVVIYRESMGTANNSLHYKIFTADLQNITAMGTIDSGRVTSDMLNWGTSMGRPITKLEANRFMTVYNVFDSAKQRDFIYGQIYNDNGKGLVASRILLSKIYGQLPSVSQVSRTHIVYVFESIASNVSVIGDDYGIILGSCDLRGVKQNVTRSSSESSSAADSRSSKTGSKSKRRSSKGKKTSSKDSRDSPYRNTTRQPTRRPIDNTVSTCIDFNISHFNITQARASAPIILATFQAVTKITNAWVQSITQESALEPVEIEICLVCDRSKSKECAQLSRDTDDTQTNTLMSANVQSNLISNGLPNTIIVSKMSHGSSTYTAVNNNNNNQNSNSSNDKTPIIVGVILSIVFLASIALFSICYFRRKASRQIGEANYVQMND